MARGKHRYWDTGQSSGTIDRLQVYYGLLLGFLCLLKAKCLGK